MSATDGKDLKAVIAGSNGQRILRHQFGHYHWRAMGIRDHPTAPCSPRQNGHVKRIIGPIRRESLDHLVVFGCSRFSAEAEDRPIAPIPILGNRVITTSGFELSNDRSCS